MPIPYNPTDSRFLAVAQARTNNGQKDVRIILDIITNEFYSLDDDGNFNPIAGGGGSQTLEQVLFQGNTTGNYVIYSPDGLSTLSIIDGNNEMLVNLPFSLKKSQLFQGGDYTQIITSDAATVEQSNFSVAIDNANILTSFPNGTGTSLVQTNQSYSKIQCADKITSITTRVECNHTEAFISHLDGTIPIEKRFTVDFDGYKLQGLPKYADDADAGSAGFSTGRLYQTNGLGAAPLNVAGIVMIKQ